MADVFDIDSNYHHRRDEYNNRNSGGWVSVESNNLRKDPRTSRRDDSRKYSPGESPLRSPQIVNKNQQMYNQIPQQQIYQPAPPPPMYNEYNSGYGAPQSYSNYQQQYQQPQNSSGFGQYNQQSAYPPQQGYSNSQHHQPVPPGEDYPNSWAPVQTAYPNINQHGPTPVPRPSSIASTVQSESHKDEIKKEAVAQELKQQRATLVKQRDEYLRKTSVLRRELEKLRMQKHELLTVKSPPRDSNRILRENAKLQLEITTKLKSINNVVDMLSGIIGDGMKTSEIEETRQEEENFPQYNYVHYDPELHWCRVCDVFPRTAKDFLNHLHSNEHRQVTQEHQLVDTPWHKLPTDPELPSYKGAPLKRVPIKGLQFFISATSWYCKLCDVWIGDLHCASLHLKSKNHSHNYSNFVEQNPHWETNWLKDREKAYARCSKIESGQKMIPQLPEPPVIKDKHKIKPEPFLDSVKKEKKRRKKSKKRKKNSSDSSSSSSSSESSSEEEDDKAKSIRVAMRNKMRMQAQMILNEEIGGKLEALRGLVEEKRNHEVKKPSPKQEPPESAIEDNIINQWMTVNTNNDKHILENLKGRLKQRQEADKEKAMEAAQEQRRREREREERELRELREREQREMEERIREEREKEQRDHEERERIKERERSRRKRRSESRSPRQRRSRSRSVGRRHYRPREERNKSPEFKPRKPREYSDDEYDKLDDYKSNKSKRLVSTLAHSRKLPFIGRMPLFKKRGEGEEKEIKKEDYEIRLSKFEHGTTARAFIPEPGVVHIAKLATPVELPAPPQISQEAPPPPKIIPEPPQISETAPPPPIINNIIPEPEPEIQDMELDEAVAPLPPGVPIQEGKPLAKPAGNHLPRDFQDALNIIFPGEQPTDPNLLMQYQYQMNYGMMYPGMDMYGYGPVEETELVPESAEAKEAIAKADLKEEAAKNDDKVDDKEDLAMLGIDAEDMAAQIF